MPQAPNTTRRACQSRDSRPEPARPRRPNARITVLHNYTFHSLQPQTLKASITSIELHMCHYLSGTRKNNKDLVEPSGLGRRRCREFFFGWVLGGVWEANQGYMLRQSLDPAFSSNAESPIPTDLQCPCTESQQNNSYNFWEKRKDLSQGHAHHLTYIQRGIHPGNFNLFRIWRTESESAFPLRLSRSCVLGLVFSVLVFSFLVFNLYINIIMIVDGHTYT
jgi:hypothetical protein